ncbi:MAG: hypothetical protein RLZ98_1518 [Pseudomonadota bacterium]|jgi:transcriptional regulator with XRE-family HTH domain
MALDWSEIIQRYRLRHGLRQQQLADLLGVSQRTVSRWERNDDHPRPEFQRILRDLCWDESSDLMHTLSNTIAYCPVPRALSVLPKLKLLAVSEPALRKRPSVKDMIGDDLAHLACGILQQVLDDRELQRAIMRREVLGIVTVTEGVLRTKEDVRGRFRTTISYFAHDGVLYSDAISVRGTPKEQLGYWPIYADTCGSDEC